MRRADRLLQIILLLRARRFATGRWLADELQVSLRTIYRDMDYLSLCGVPVEGEAGVGYRLRKGFELPPLMFDAEELRALLLGARMVAAWADDELARSARYALNKIQAAIPESYAAPLDNTHLYVPDFHDYPRERLRPIREAIDRQHRLAFDYRRADGTPSQRRVRPLGLYFWGGVWTLAAWCEHRSDFRNFRLDRIGELTVTEEPFPEEAGRSLEDFLQAMRVRG